MLPPPTPFVLSKRMENKDETVGVEGSKDNVEQPTNDSMENNNEAATVETPADNIEQPTTVNMNKKSGIIQEMEQVNNPENTDNLPLDEQDQMDKITHPKPDEHYSDSDHGLHTPDNSESDIQLPQNSDHDIDLEAHEDMDISKDDEELMVIECMTCGKEYLHKCYASTSDDSNDSETQKHYLDLDNM